MSADSDIVDIDLSEADPAWEPSDDELAKNYGIEVEPELKPLTKAAAAAAIKHRLSKIGKILDLPKPPWFVEGLIPSAPVTILHGQSGTKKSFLMLDWALCCSTGQQWHGRDIQAGRVLYIVAEGVAGMGKRLRAWAAHNDYDPYGLDRIDFMAVPINFHAIDANMARHWAQVVEFFGYDLIIVDTLHMSSYGADENSSKDMGNVFAMARLMAGTARLMFAHHDPKDGSKTGRGSGSIRDDSDVVIRLAEQDPYTSVLHAEKLKDAENFPPIACTFAKWEGVDETSLYLDDITVGVDSVTGPKPLTAVDKCGLAIVEHDFLDMGWGAGRTKDELRKLDLGYRWSEATVGRALHQLRAEEHEVAHLLAQHPKDVT